VKNLKFAIYPTNEQSECLERWIAICRQVYNSALLDRSRYYKQHKKGLNRYDQQKQLVIDKKKHAILKEIPSQPLQESLHRLDKAFQNFFSKRAKYPKIKSGDHYRSLTFTQFGIGVTTVKTTVGDKKRPVRYACSLGKGGMLSISKLGDIAINYHTTISGKIKQVIIKHENNGKWFAIFSVDEKHGQAHGWEHNRKEIGADVGLTHFATLSNGEVIPNPHFLKKKEKYLKRQQRKLSRKVKGSANRKKQKAIVNRTHAKVKNQRKDFLHKESRKLANRFELVALEDLKIKNMVKNRKLSKAISSVGWGMFKQFLSYKCEQNGGLLIKVQPQYTTVACSSCGKYVKKSLSIRTHICTCGCRLDRDHNAAINILKKAKEQLLKMNA
jgi:putative transposase